MLGLADGFIVGVVQHGRYVSPSTAGQHEEFGGYPSDAHIANMPQSLPLVGEVEGLLKEGASVVGASVLSQHA